MRWPSLLEVDLDRFRYASTKSVRASADLISDLVAQGNYRDAVANFCNDLCFRPFDVLSEANYAAFANYCAAIAAARAGDIEAARQHLSAANIPFSGDFDLLPFEAAVAYGQELRRRQLECIAKRKPGVHIVALPKSASGYLSNTVSLVLDVPVARSSMVCRTPTSALDYFVVETWARLVAQGGCVTHEHVGPSHGNLEILEECGVRKLIVQIRDPRASLFSLYHHMFGSDPPSETIPPLGSFAREYYGHLVNWLDGWIQYEGRSDRQMDLYFLNYESIRTDAVRAIAKAITFATGLDLEATIASSLEERGKSGEAPHNFRLGEPDGWRGAADEELVDWFWQNTPDRVRAVLKMVK